MENNMKNYKRINLGSGNDYREGWVNVDENEHVKADIRHNLNLYPYPFSDNEFEEVLASHVIEHLDDPLDFLQEIYRIAKPGARVTIRCPHFSCNWIHPRHKSAISTKLFDFLANDSTERYLEADFKVEKVVFKWISQGQIGKRNKPVMRFLNHAISGLANLNPAITERIWCYWVGGFEEMIFEVRVNKSIY